MAAFSYEKHHPFLLDSSSSVFLFPNTTSDPKLSHTINNSSNMSSFLEQQINNNYSPCFSPPHQHHPFYDQPNQTVEVSSWTSSINISATSSIATKGTICTNNSSSSDVIAPHQLINPIHKMKNSPQHSHSKMNGKKQRKASTNNSSIGEGCIMRSDGGEEKPINKKRSRRGDDQKKNDGQEIEKEAPTGYIHVRARRGQATDSHSLAERARREKISERMKLLQTLVPGCDKVTGKALMLDEIIKYVQSLQNQVEFLSMKIASVNPMLYDFGMDMDSVMVKPERMSSLEAAQQQDVQQQNNNQLDTNIFNTSGGYTLVDTSTLHQIQQAQMPNIMSHPENNNGQLLWNTDEQKQKFIISQSGFTNNSSSFHLQ